MSELGHRIDTSGVQPKVLRNWIRDLLGLWGGSLSLLFESFAFRDGIPLDADWVVDARMLPNPHYEPELAPLTGRDAPVIAFLEGDAMVRAFLEDLRAFLATLAAGGQARQPQLSHGRHRLHRRAPPLGVPRGTAGTSFGAEWRVLVRHRGLGAAHRAGG